MVKYCNGCKRDLEIDNFYSYKKSTCRERVNGKVKCYYSDKEFSSTNLSKHIKQTHSTHKSSRTNDSTSNSSRKKDSTTNRSPNNDSNSYSISEQIDDSSYYNLSDHKKLFMISLTHGKILIIMIKKINPK